MHTKFQLKFQKEEILVLSRSDDLYFDVQVGLVWSNDPESNAGGSIATGRAKHAGQVEGDDPD
jgi:hypothetical protein